MVPCSASFLQGFITHQSKCTQRCRVGTVQMAGRQKILTFQRSFAGSLARSLLPGRVLPVRAIACSDEFCQGLYEPRHTVRIATDTVGGAGVFSRITSALVTTRTQTALRNFESASFSQQKICNRNSHVVQNHFRVSCRAHKFNFQSRTQHVALVAIRTYHVVRHCIRKH